jgi:hypothetical protein
MTQPVTPYGVDIQTLPNPAAGGALDLDPSMTEGTGRALLAQSLLRRQSTPTGSVVDSPNDCIDLRSWISQGWTQQQMQAAAGGLKAELLKDERVLDVSVSMSYNPSTLTLTITELITSSYGPFSLTLSVNSVTVSQLTANQGSIGQGLPI